MQAVGPMVYGRLSKRDEVDLKNTVEAVYNLAMAHKVSSIAIPAVASGIFGFPKEKCAKIMIEATIDFCKNEANGNVKDGKRIVEEIHFTNIDRPTSHIFKTTFEENLKVGKISPSGISGTSGTSATSGITGISGTSGTSGASNTSNTSK